ncbi:MAG: DegT/DnrJ/EryC1/StrS family aminotransferase [Candidatus Adiutrix sp.]|jgi:dTDP-4-amino-4,6-dideoxygalactose transaminase|nr:DegT/DnrJ/EryC1/StrS family aminotransferase [Candidatus Adiutrix sp.]
MRFIDLAAQQKRIRADIDARIKAVLDHNSYILGPEVGELEGKLARFAGAKHCIGCSSGTDALIIPLLAWGVGPGQAVFVPAFSFFATAETVALLGATPVMVDIDPVTFNIDPRALDLAVSAVRKRDNTVYPLPRAALEPGLEPRAVIPVDLFGQPADYDALLPAAQRHGLLTLEDAAQSFGAEYRGRKTCGLGCLAGATSFFPAKPLGGYGDGGAIFTDDDGLAGLCRSILVHGQGRDRYDNARLGLNGRLDTLQAAVLLAKLEIFSEELAARQKVARWYGEALAAVPGLTTPSIAAGRFSSWAQYCVLVADGRRDALAARLKERDIPTAIYYPTPMHRLTALEYLGYAAEDMPTAQACSGKIMALPFHPYLSEAEVGQVGEAVARAMRDL